MRPKTILVDWFKLQRYGYLHSTKNHNTVRAFKLNTVFKLKCIFFFFAKQLTCILILYMWYFAQKKNICGIYLLLFFEKICGIYISLTMQTEICLKVD